MKKLVLLLLFVLSLFFVAAEEPPSFDHEQFYGTIYWDKNGTAPVVLVAKVGTVEYTSSINDLSCAESCSGKYGYTPQNILRVQGKSGDMIFFYVGTIKVGQAVYEPGKSVLTPFDMRTVIVPAAPCNQNWNCSAWSSCSSNERSRFCTDLNACSIEALNKTEVEKNCDVTPSSKDSKNKKPKNQTNGSFPTLSKCTYNWECGGWSSCIGSVQTRSCLDINSCDAKLKKGDVSSITKYPKPAESKMCIASSVDSGDAASGSSVPDSFVSTSLSQSTQKKESCVDGIKNQNEEDVDCGGVCTKCPETDYMIWVYVGLLIIVVAGIGGGIYYTLKLRNAGSSRDIDTNLELRSAYDRGMARGLSQDEITRKLVERGWDQPVLERFLRRNK